MKRILLFVTSLALLTQAASSTRAQTPDALKFFKNFFVTGDYVVGGVGLRGLGVNGIATGSIQLGGVPDKADVLAAFLYWQVVAKGTGGAAVLKVSATSPGTWGDETRIRVRKPNATDPASADFNRALRSMLTPKISRQLA